MDPMVTFVDKAQVSLPSEQEVQVKRRFRAPRPMVWEAWTRPELVRRWMLGPPGWTMPVCDMNVTAGGTFAWRWRSEEDGMELSCQLLDALLLKGPAGENVG